MLNRDEAAYIEELKEKFGERYNDKFIEILKYGYPGNLLEYKKKNASLDQEDDELPELLVKDEMDYLTTRNESRSRHSYLSPIVKGEDICYKVLGYYFGFNFICRHCITNKVLEKYRDILTPVYYGMGLQQLVCYLCNIQIEEFYGWPLEGEKRPKEKSVGALTSDEDWEDIPDFEEIIGPIDVLNPAYCGTLEEYYIRKNTDWSQILGFTKYRKKKRKKTDESAIGMGKRYLADEDIPAEELQIISELRKQKVPISFDPPYSTKRFQIFQSRPKVFLDKSLSSDKTLSTMNIILEKLISKTPFTMLQHPKFGFPNTWSTTVWIYHKYRSYFSTFGKGITIQAAMCSGFGEMLERIQGLQFRSFNRYKPQLAFLSKTKKEISEIDDSLNREFLDILRANTAVPSALIADYKAHKNFNYYLKYHKFKDLLKQDHYIWIKNALHHNTTGLAAGNSYEEAIMEAIFEIVERYCSFTTLHNQIALPTVSKSKLSGPIKDTIDKIEKSGVIGVTIYDASLVGIPTAAVLIDLKKYRLNDFTHEKYMLKFGAGSTFNVAVERCITETLQGQHALEGNSLAQKSFTNSMKVLYKLFNIKDIAGKRNFLTDYYARSGIYSSKMLNFLINPDPSKIKKDIQYKEFASDDLYDEVQSAFDIFKERKYRAYMKDLNFLDFPTVKIFIPELNVGYLNLMYYTTRDIEDFKVKIISQISSLRPEDLDIMLDPYMAIQAFGITSAANLLSIRTIQLEKISAALFLGKLAHAFSRMDIARRYYRLHNLQETLYGYRNKAISKIEMNKSPEDVKDEIFRIIPNCLSSCDNCKFQAQCKYTYLKQYQKMLAEENGLLELISGY
ncbi:MAG: hypothetical protein GF364_12165 [Candidatus Lokiarchaeota archaeon]|nr:hypothetical protein [Candidatus Lokiarchaeota archaeon]